MPISVPDVVGELLARLQEAGYAAYVVGGCVRDSLRGTVPHDWDVTTAATPEQTLALFADRSLYAVGQQHGTIAVITDAGPVEITTFRVEGGYSDHRRPDTVRFVTDVTEDLRRRDFTINAMAYNDREGLIDPFGGQRDLAERYLRCVGDARQRFSEDALRLLRGLRFAAVMGFSLVPDTAAALCELAPLLRDIAAERIAAELTRLIGGSYARTVLSDYREVIAVVLPDLAPMFDFDQRNPHHIYDVYQHTLHVLEAVPSEPVLRWAALFHDSGKPDSFTLDDAGVGHFYGHAALSVEHAHRSLTALRLDNDTICKVTELVRYHDRPILPTPPAVRRVLNRLGETQLRRLIALKRADNAAHAPQYSSRAQELSAVETVLSDVLRRQDCFSLKNLAVKGNDITLLGVPAGPLVGELLNRLLNAVMDGNCENDRNALLKLAGEFFGNEATHP